MKVSAEAQKLAKRQSGNLAKSAPKKKMKSAKAPNGIIRELRCLAAFQAQLYIFTKVEKSKADLRYAQLIEGSGAFSLLYDIREGELNVELVLKTSCCGKDTSYSYIAGVHFTEDDVHFFWSQKKSKWVCIVGNGVYSLAINQEGPCDRAKTLPTDCNDPQNLRCHWLCVWSK